MSYKWEWRKQEDIRVYLFNGMIAEVCNSSYPREVSRRGEIIRTYTRENVLKADVIIIDDTYGLKKGDRTVIHLAMKNEELFGHIRVREKKEVILDKL